MTLSGRIDLPDEAARIKILEAQLSKMPWNPIDLQEFAHRMPGASAAKLRAVVDQTAGYALADNRKIEAEDLRRALHGHGGKDRPQLERVDWDNVVVSKIAQTRPEVAGASTRTRSLGLEIPVGLLLVGPPGAGRP